MKIRLVVSFLICSMVVSGCMQINPIVVKSVQCCDLKKSRNTEPEITFQLEIENPNDFDITIQKYDLAIRINGNNIGNALDSEPSELKAKSMVTKTISVQTSTRQLVSGTLLMGLNALMKKDRTTLDAEIVGSVVAKAKGVSKRVKVRESYPIQMHP